MTEMRKRLAIGSIWTAGVRAAVSLMGLISTVVLARLLTPEDFGLVAVAAVVFAIISAFSQLSLAEALIQHAEPKREHFDSAWTMGVLRGLGVSFFLIIIASGFAAFGDPRIAFVMGAFGFAAMMNGLQNPRIVEFRRRLSFHQELLIQLAEKLAGLIAAITIAVIYQSFWAIVIGALASQLVSLILSYVLIPYLPRFSLHEWRSLLSFSGWIALGSGVREVNWRADQLLVGALLGTPMLGQYNVGGRLASLPVQESIAPLVHVLFPAFAKLQNEPDRLRDAFLRSQRLLAMIAVPVGVGFALVAEPVVAFVLGPQWAAAGLVIQVLSAIFAIQVLASPFLPMAMGLGQTRLIFVRDIINLIVRYPIIIVGLFWGGLIGLLLARCITGTFILLLDLLLSRRLIGVSVQRQILASWRVGVSAGLMALAVWAMQLSGFYEPALIDIAILIAVGVVTYLASTLLLWVLSGKPAGPEQEIVNMLDVFRPGTQRV